MGTRPNKKAQCENFLVVLFLFEIKLQNALCSWQNQFFCIVSNQPIYLSILQQHHGFGILDFSCCQ